MKNTFMGVIILLGVVGSLAGCRPAAVSANPDKAGATLRQTLDAWKNGEPLEALRRRASITVAEPQWQGGTKLLDYEVLGAGEMVGFDWQCKVKLSLQSAGGKKSQERAIYSVSTSPALVVVRGEP